MTTLTLTAARQRSWIREARDEVGLDQEQLANLAGISRRSLAAYERGETAVPPPKRVLLEQALQRRREELGYEQPTAGLADRLRGLEAIDLRMLALLEQIQAALVQTAQQLTELRLTRFSRESITRAVEAELAGQDLHPAERRRLVAALQGEAEGLVALAARLEEPRAAANTQRPPRAG